MTKTRKTRGLFAIAVCLSVLFAACDTDVFDDNPGGGIGGMSTLEIVNQSSQSIHTVHWNNVWFTDATVRQQINPGTSAMMSVPSGSGFVNFTVGSREMTSGYMLFVGLWDHVVYFIDDWTIGGDGGGFFPPPPPPPPPGDDWDDFFPPLPPPGGGGGATQNQVTIVNDSPFYLTHVRWGDVQFTFGANYIPPGGRSTRHTQLTSSFLRFRPTRNPANLRSEHMVSPIGDTNEIRIFYNTRVVREFDLAAGARNLQDIAGIQLRIGDTGPGGGIIFFEQGGEFREISMHLGMSNASDAISAASNLSAGGFRDWRLPDSLNLSLMFDNLHSADPPLGGFTNARYWGGRVGSSFNSHFMDFGDGTLHSVGSFAENINGISTNTASNMRVRAMRTFSVH